MAIRVLVNGAFGRMGLMSAAALKAHPVFILAGQTGRGHDLAKAIADSQAEVVLDFTHPEVVFNNTLTIIEAGARPVIGTSGLTRDQVADIGIRCDAAKRGCVIAPNFSLGAVLMMKHAQAIAGLMPQVEIIEMHHDSKADSPSGTAMRSAEMLAARRASTEPASLGHETVAHARGALYQGIPIHAVRLPGLLASQQIIFGNTGETLTLRHDSIDRSCFMPGVCLACERVMSLNHLIYGLDELLI